MLIIGCLLWLSFLVVEWKVAALPVLPLHLFKYRTVSAIFAQTVFVGMVYYGNLYLSVHKPLRDGCVFSDTCLIIAFLSSSSQCWGCQLSPLHAIYFRYWWSRRRRVGFPRSVTRVNTFQLHGLGVTNGQITMRTGRIKPQIIAGFAFWFIGAGLETLFPKILRGDGEGGVVWWSHRSYIVG
jgi:hypothetical protein